MLEFHLAKYNFSIWCIIGFDLRFVFFVFSLKSHAPARRLVETPLRFPGHLAASTCFCSFVFSTIKLAKGPSTEARNDEEELKHSELWRVKQFFAACVHERIFVFVVSVVSESILAQIGVVTSLRASIAFQWPTCRWTRGLNLTHKPTVTLRQEGQADEQRFRRSADVICQNMTSWEEDDQSWQTVWKGAMGCQSQKGCYFLVACLLHSRNLEDITKNVRDQR